MAYPENRDVAYHCEKPTSDDGGLSGRIVLFVKMMLRMTP